MAEDGILKWYVAKDICNALDIRNSRDAVSRLDDDEKRMMIMDTPGGKQKLNMVNVQGVYRLLLSSNKDYARKYQRWIIHDVLPFVQQENSYLTQVNKRIDELKGILEESGIVRPFVNPRYTFDNLKIRFCEAVSGSRARDFYEALGDWHGVTVPYSASINITVKEWLLQNIPLEGMLELVNGIESKTIIRSRAGHWVSLNGVFGNSTEWPKIKRNFGNCCAYCGTKTTLIPEHIIAQSTLSKTTPGRVDLMENIVPACSSCNGSKGKLNFIDWFKKQPFYTKRRHEKIKNHYRKYHIE